MASQKIIREINWGLIGLTLLLGGIGILILYSATGESLLGFSGGLYMKQMMLYGLGLMLVVLLQLFDYRYLNTLWPLIYILGMLLLVGVVFVGHSGGGSQRWITLGPISGQPSEFIKVVMVIVLAHFFAKQETTTGLTLRNLAIPVVLVLMPVALILKQPDLGTAIVLLVIAGTMTFVAKVERKTFIGFLSVGIISAPLLWLFGMKTYQQQRVLTFLDPDRDPLGAGYHIIQSKIAIGSGGFLGKGFLKGTQNALSFLPEQHTDFIFAVLAEELGFLRSIVVLTLFVLLIFMGLNIAMRSRDTFGAYLSLGVVSILFWQVFINIGMVMGLFPVVGVPLPFISYGGSSLVAMMLCVGILLNVDMRRFRYK